jgi:AcrR family transcriptional regulator
VAAREYRLGRRQAEVDRTRRRILAAAHELVSELGPQSSLGKVAQRAGVSRITVYNQFRSKAGLLDALSAESGRRPADGARGDTATDPREDLKLRIGHACAAWAADSRLHRQLGGRAQGERSEDDHALAQRLAANDCLRPGCSIKEAEDVIGILTSFPTFDRLHNEGRRSVAGVAEILLRMASGFLTAPAQV